jgi:ATP-dependent exoDNAse (exonuclease V) alpha subunit
VGDERQLQAIEAGGAFAALRKRLGGVELRSITRQREEWMRDAVRQFAEGDARGALTQYALAERLHVEADRTAAKSRLIKDWSEKRTADLSQTIILASTKDDVHGLNREAQAVRLKAGELKRSEILRGTLLRR